ncbi:uncharacterized protein AMSG_01925, partial [Thecamonas trahens ATCC 50062]
VAVAGDWLVSQGWRLAAYALAPSVLQTAPVGIVAVDVGYMGEDDDGSPGDAGSPGQASEPSGPREVDEATWLARSRVLEVDVARREVVTVLAARPRALAAETAALVGAQTARVGMDESSDDDDDEVTGERVAGAAAEAGEAESSTAAPPAMVGVDDDLAAVVKARSVEYYLQQAAELLGEEGGDEGSGEGSGERSGGGENSLVDVSLDSLDGEA